MTSLRYLPAPLDHPRISLGQIPRGYRGTLRTVRQVARLIREGAKDFYVRQRAIDILLARRIRPKDYLGEIQALFEWMQQNVRYTKDPVRVEVLHTPRRLLSLRAGDCDDMTILLGALLESIGHPVRLVLTGPDPARPRLFSHIYLEVNLQNEWIPLDATMPHPVGWSPNAVVRRVIPIVEERSPNVSSTTAHAPHPAGHTPMVTRAGARGRARADQPPRPARKVAVEPAARAGPPGQKPLAAKPASVHVAARPSSQTETQDDSPADPVAPRVGAVARPQDSRGGSDGRSLGKVYPARALYRAFNGFPAARIDRVRHARLIPPVVVQLGELLGLIYRSDKWEAGKPRTFIHFMERPPRLVSDPAGRQLYLVGGNYTVTARGIEG
jgi:hypothetical protein